MITLHGHLERITYRQGRSSFIIGKMRVDGTHQVVSVLGSMAGVKPGDRLRLQGNWETHEKYGPQFRVSTVEILPADPLESIRKFLSSGLITGIGPKLAGKLLVHFDVKILDVLEADPQRLSEVSGISPNKAPGIADAWRSQATRRAKMILQGHGVSAFHAERIVKAFGPATVEIIQKEPYRLSADVHEIDFFLADRIALRMGLDPKDLRRFHACILYLMEKAIGRGDTYVDGETLISSCHEILEKKVDPADIAAAIDSLVSAGMLVKASIGGKAEGVYLSTFHAAETGIANRLAAMRTVPVSTVPPDREEITATVLRSLAIKPSDEQMAVLSDIFSHRVFIITGGPGTGKTTLTRSVWTLFNSLGKRIILAAPTGRAARRLSEVTGKKAETIHKLLRYHPEEARFERDETNPIEADVVIVDEASMVDTLLMFQLLRAVPMTAVFILVGDVFQLPPIGPGNVLSDLIQSGRIRTFELTQIFRQARQSAIVVAAHRVRTGQPLALVDTDPETLDSAFYFMEKHRPDEVVDTVKHLCAELIPRRFHLDPIRDIQVLTPVHRGEGGTLNLNQELQGVLNESRIQTEKRGRGFWIGDKVMHLKNNYPKEVFNGDIGTVSRIDTADEQLFVDFDGREVAYGFDELGELSLAYAISVHKSQGSEYPAVVVLMMPQHSGMLQRNLLYTALTRGQRFVFLVGSQQAVETALNTDTPRRRLSGLSYRLTEACDRQW